VKGSPAREIDRIVLEARTMFRDRSEAGKALAQFIAPSPNPSALVLAVPRGGIPVAEPLVRALGGECDIALVRKLPIPQSPEAGFGAVALDGSTVINKDLTLAYRLTPSVIEQIKAEVLAEIQRRAAEYRGHTERPDMAGRDVYLVDDGLASGYTMIATAKMARAGGAQSLTVCVPVAPVASIDRIEPFVDRIICLIAQERAGFAVASFYQDFHDMTDAEVLAILERSRQ
jgi:putative phosphoribosyl transferase